MPSVHASYQIQEQTALPRGHPPLCTCVSAQIHMHARVSCVAVRIFRVIPLLHIWKEECGTLPIGAFRKSRSLAQTNFQDFSSDTPTGKAYIG